MWTGAVFDSGSGPASFCVPHADFARELDSKCQSRWALLFAVSGPDQGEVAAIVDAVCRAAGHSSQPGPHQADAQGEHGGCYARKINPQ